jgi:hypothetical protein
MFKPPSRTDEIRDRYIYPDTAYWDERRKFEECLLEYLVDDVPLWNRQTGSDWAMSLDVLWTWVRYLRDETSKRLRHLSPLWEESELEDNLRSPRPVESDTDYEEDDLIKPW